MIRELTPEEERGIALMIPCAVCLVGVAFYCKSNLGKAEFIHSQRIVNALRLRNHVLWLERQHAEGNVDEEG